MPHLLEAVGRNSKERDITIQKPRFTNSGSSFTKSLPLSVRRLPRAGSQFEMHFQIENSVIPMSSDQVLRPVSGNNDCSHVDGLEKVQA